MLVRRKAAGKMVLLTLSISLAAMPVSARASEKLVKRVVSGKVVATDTQDKPNTIVVKAKAGRQSLIVGADVTDKTVIRKGGRAITLGDIRPGESVDMAYTRNSDVAATSITVK